MEETVSQVLDALQERTRPHWSLICLMLVMVAVFMWSGWGHFTWFGTISSEGLDQAGALNTELVDAGEFWRLGMSVILHAGWLHLITNLLNIYVLGMFVLALYGHRWTWIPFLFSGMSGSLLTWAFGTERTVGASGAIFGWIGMLLVIGWKYRSDLQGEGGQLFRRSLLGWTVISIIIGELVPFIDNTAHIGGLLAGVAFGAMIGIREAEPLSDQSSRSTNG